MYRFSHKIWVKQVRSGYSWVIPWKALEPKLLNSIQQVGCPMGDPEGRLLFRWATAFERRAGCNHHWQPHMLVWTPPQSQSTLSGGTLMQLKVLAWALEALLAPFPLVPVSSVPSAWNAIPPPPASGISASLAYLLTLNLSIQTHSYFVISFPHYSIISYSGLYSTVYSLDYPGQK